MATVDPAYIGKVVADPFLCLPSHVRANAALQRQVTELALGGRGIQKVQPNTFSKFPYLTLLWLDRNRLTSLENIDHPPTLKRLYVNNNAITAIEPIAALRALELLDLSHNACGRLDALLDTLDCMEQLRVLLLVGNPASREPGYRARVLARLPWLHSLDNHAVSSGEVQEALREYASTARGAARAQARQLSHSLTMTAKHVSAARGAEAIGTGLLPHGGYPPLLGRGGSPFVHPRPDIRFGGDAETTTAADTRRAVRSIQEKRQDAALEATRRQFEEGGTLASWGDLTDARTGQLGTGMPGDERPLYVTSALINVDPPWSSEDVVTKAVRLGMLARGVEPEFLRLDRMALVPPSVTSGSRQLASPNKGKAAGSKKASRGKRRASLAEATAVHDASVAMLNYTAPVVETRHASHPIAWKDTETRGVQPSASASQLARTTPLTSPILSSTHRALSAALAQAGSAIGQRMPEQALVHTVLRDTGVRLSTMRSRKAVDEKFGLGSSSLPPSSSSRVSFEGKPLPPHVPLLPGLQPTGHLGQWDQWKLSQIFRAADVDGSGELTRDEIRACLTAVADYGFCVDMGGDGSVDSSTTALIGTVGRAADTSAAMNRLTDAVNTIFDAIDVDSSGAVTWREFLDAVQTGQVEEKQQEGKEQGKKVPQLRFRCLTSTEAAARAERYWHIAQDSERRAQTYPSHDPHREARIAELNRTMTEASVKAVRLEDIAKALGGKYDPPERPPTPPARRHDSVRFTSLIPAAEEAKRRARGGRYYKVPYPGEEEDRDERAIRTLLQPGPAVIGVELDDDSGNLTRRRLAETAAAVATLHDSKWERWRMKTKAREPHAVSTVKAYF